MGFWRKLFGHPSPDDSTPTQATLKVKPSERIGSSPAATSPSLQLESAKPCTAYSCGDLADLYIYATEFLIENNASGIYDDPVMFSQRVLDSLVLLAARDGYSKQQIGRDLLGAAKGKAALVGLPPPPEFAERLKKEKWIRLKRNLEVAIKAMGFRVEGAPLQALHLVLVGAADHFTFMQHLFEDKDVYRGADAKTTAALISLPAEVSERATTPSNGPPTVPRMPESANTRIAKLRRAVVAAPRMPMHPAVELLMNELVPNLAPRSVSEIHDEITAWNNGAEMASFNTASDLKWFVNPVLQGMSAHVDDEYGTALLEDSSVAAIVVHNKGSQGGRILILPVWRSEDKWHSGR